MIYEGENGVSSQKTKNILSHQTYLNILEYDR